MAGSYGSSYGSFLKRLSNSPKWLHHFTFPLAAYEKPCCSTPSLTPGLISFPLLDMQVGVW